MWTLSLTGKSGISPFWDVKITSEHGALLAAHRLSRISGKAVIPMRVREAKRICKAFPPPAMPWNEQELLNVFAINVEDSTVLKVGEVLPSRVKWWKEQWGQQADLANTQLLFLAS